MQTPMSRNYSTILISTTLIPPSRSPILLSSRTSRALRTLPSKLPSPNSQVTITSKMPGKSTTKVKNGSSSPQRPDARSPRPKAHIGSLPTSRSGPRPVYLSRSKLRISLLPIGQSIATCPAVMGHTLVCRPNRAETTLTRDSTTRSGTTTSRPISPLI